MDRRENRWVALLTAGLAAAVAGVLLLETASWTVQYSVLGLGLLLTLAAVYDAAESSSAV